MERFIADRIIGAIKENTRAQAETARAINNLVELMCTEMFFSRNSQCSKGCTSIAIEADCAKKRIDRLFLPKFKIYIDGTPQDDADRNPWQIPEEATSLEEAKAMAFDHRFSPDWRVDIYTRGADPSDSVILSRWKPEERTWTDRKENIAKFFKETGE